MEERTPENGSQTRLSARQLLQRLKQLGITLAAPPQPFGIYAEAVQASGACFF